jgi:hypothetical protein
LGQSAKQRHRAEAAQYYDAPPQPNRVTSHLAPPAPKQCQDS